ncbi:rhodanese [Chromatiales bacterium (ex Bugula neritina AB1)]|nr:rhodanese [Chromatiales bacterium (ex Bugula neritina AB1)]
MKKGIKQLIAEANEVVETITAEEAIALQGNENVTIVDLRDVRELQREGRIPGSVHAPRGMLEFWVDPDSPYHKPVFATGNRMVLHCASGWRSALAAQSLHTMGLDNVCHIETGFKGWKEAGGSTEKVEKK